MFSGKTEELIRRLNRSVYARQHVKVFKPKVDTRYAEEAVVSHSDRRIECVPVEKASDILSVVGDAEVVGIDEAQFFDSDLVDVCSELANRGIRVVVAGLDKDYLGEPFQPIPQLLSVAEYITKVHAVCMVCGAPANFSQRMVDRERRVLLGASDTYEARCRQHFEPELFSGQQENLPLGESTW